MDFTTPILGLVFNMISAYIGWRILKPRLMAEIAQFIGQEIDYLLDYVIKNPQELAPLIDSLIGQGMKSLGVDKVAKPGRLRIGGISVPGELAQAAMPFVLDIAKKFAKGGAEKAVENALG